MKKVIIIILVVLVGIYFSKNILTKVIVSTGVKAVSGLNLKIESMDIGVFRHIVEVKGLELFNPPDFPEALMVDLPEFYLDYDLAAFLKNKIHLNVLKLNLKEFRVIKDKSGRLNLDALRALQPKKSGKVPGFRIDILELKISKVTYKDYSKGSLPKTAEFNVNIDERYNNITDPYTLTALIVTKALINTTINRLANFDLEALKSSITNILGDTVGLTKETANTVLGVVDNVTEKVIDKATESLKKILSNKQE